MNVTPATKINNKEVEQARNVHFSVSEKILCIPIWEVNVRDMRTFKRVAKNTYVAPI